MDWRERVDWLGTAGACAAGIGDLAPRAYAIRTRRVAAARPASRRIGSARARRERDRRPVARRTRAGGAGDLRARPERHAGGAPALRRRPVVAGPQRRRAVRDRVLP